MEIKQNILRQPGTKESKLKLIDECKNRAKGLITGRNFPAAIELYGKAISTIETVEVSI